ncbi:hypothetical protein GH714_013956 [Hevea brasiliensis]|uniref:Pentacotripeptide-repeat region of PRORP domain-containing protein n=1 Tax=Hevea brasiliensis TaxID=3981 RepID=A0A6A6LGF5_HEVBR|nr:hypothetical protein GH714_013956 [Hevea brasiliensis]
MLQKNMILDAIAYSFIVYAEVRLGNLDSAMEVYEKMLKRGFSANSFVYTSSVDPNEEIYEALIIGHFENGDKTRAFHLYNEMISKELKPCCSYDFDASTMFC